LCYNRFIIKAKAEYDADQGGTKKGHAKIWGLIDEIGVPNKLYGSSVTNLFK
jgi:hypothetical protein